jgi:hypothetical protein
VTVYADTIRRLYIEGLDLEHAERHRLARVAQTHAPTDRLRLSAYYLSKEAFDTHPGRYMGRLRTLRDVLPASDKPELSPAYHAPESIRPEPPPADPVGLTKPIPRIKRTTN